MTGVEKAYAGEWYQFRFEPTCRAATEKAWRMVPEINAVGVRNRKKGIEMLVAVCPNIHPTVDIVFPITTLDYLDRIYIGENTFVNMGFVHLSSGRVSIGKDCFIGPNAHFYTPNHEIEDLELRRAAWQYDAPITVGDDCWFGGDVTVVPGVTIGSNVVVGAGSVVTKDVPNNCVVAGNPARIVKQI
jgi:maltose O-acetyltransferase